jgi:hypothetical protein
MQSAFCSRIVALALDGKMGKDQNSGGIYCLAVGGVQTAGD